MTSVASDLLLESSVETVASDLQLESPVENVSATILRNGNLKFCRETKLITESQNEFTIILEI